MHQRSGVSSGQPGRGCCPGLGGQGVTGRAWGHSWEGKWGKEHGPKGLLNPRPTPHFTGEDATASEAALPGKLHQQQIPAPLVN